MKSRGCSAFCARCHTCLWVCNLCVRHLALNHKVHIILSSDQLILVLSSCHRSLKLFWPVQPLEASVVASESEMYITAGVCSVMCQTNSCAFLRLTVPRTVVLFAFHSRTVLTNVRTTKRGTLCTCRGCTCSHDSLSVCFSLLLGIPILLLDIIDVSCLGVHILQVQQLASL